MCGIFYLNKNLVNFLNSQKIMNYFQKLKHRGPDHTGYLQKNDQFFGTHRLSIINPKEEGNQPLVLGDSILICNGQIYNYLELANKYKIPVSELRTDVDIILQLYHQGIKMEEIGEQLDGVFAFVLYDASKDTIYIGRDAVGVRPLFILENENRYIEAISSEVKSLIEIKKERNDLKLHSFNPGALHIQEGYSQRCLKGHICMSQFFSFKKNKEDLKIAYPKIRELLEKAVQKRIDSSDRPVAFLCSGGVDSSIILAIAHKYLEKQGRDLHVYSMQYEGCTSYDAFYASMLVQQYQKPDAKVKVHYHPIKFNFKDVLEVLDKIPVQIESYDPNTIRASIPMYLLASKLKETEFKVFLSGEGADELFLGYNYLKYAPSPKEANYEEIRLLYQLGSFDVLRADRCFSAHGLELRVPYLDKDLVHYVTGLDGSLKMYQHGVEKALLRESFRDSNYSELASSGVLDRQKERFSDGCGFSYVLDLLNDIYRKFQKFHKKSQNVTLEEKEKYEKLYYLGLFNHDYPGLKHLIPERKLPDWCSEISQNKNKKVLET